ncbi:rho GTPase-activating protein 44 [Biomphalaria pfeifferi]|uniref:Rho GTPase-activating protein 44 n=1 Tax=Biomphalaria pfeifferi TaxID=112525 RepID=A0AAD8BBQ8_BIOPF|nr:rho GTPase-activating protein 44 [Biomphalaria pfeifferi]
MFKKENLRKNLLRVKQNIDQNLGRAEKSEVLSEDQQENEKRVELVKHAFQNVTKKAAATLQSNGTDFDKRLKKLPESGLSAALLDSAQTLGTETLLSTVCKLCGECQSNLATEQVNYEIRVETEFINPLQTICDVDIPSIIKLRKALNKSTLDMDSAKSRFSQAVRQSQVPGANMTTAAAKAETIKEEYEEATLKVETIKDNLSIELCNFAAKESDQSQKMLLLLEAQADYHRKALQAIEQFIPLVKVRIDNAPCKPVYGMPLEEHLRLMKRDISLVIEACVTVLLECGLEEEGLFRIAGAAIKLKKLKACFDAQSLDMEEFSNDPHTVAGALKQYLRELPEPLLTFAMHDEFLKAATLPLDQRLQTLWTLIQKLPVANFNNFRYLVKFLAKLAEKSDINKMKPSNIAIVIGPNLLWSETSNAPNMLTTGTLSAIIEAIVTHADWFFPGAFDFHLTALGSSPKPSTEPGLLSDSAQFVNNKTIDAPAKQDLDKKGNTAEKPLCSKTRTLPLEQGFIVSSSDTYPLRFPEKCDEEESSSDESNPFSEKFALKSKTGGESVSEKGGMGKESDVQRVDLGDRQCDISGSTNTGDYDNILYTINPLNPSARCSSMNPTDRRASADNVSAYGKCLPAPVPPCRPSRPTKKPLPPEKTSCMPSGPRAEVSRSVDTLPDVAQPSSRYMIGSTPNITALPYHRNEEETYSGLQSQFWNRPNQKSNFNSLKRGSDPCIIPPPSQFNNYSTHRPLKLSRAHLGTPPKPGEMSRSQPASHAENSRAPYSPPQEMSQSQPAPYVEKSPYSPPHEMSLSQPSPILKSPANHYNPVDKSFHQDTYNTAFALSSLGAGNKSADYLTRVRAMWDDRHQQQGAKPQNAIHGKREELISSSLEFTPKQHPTTSYNNTNLVGSYQKNIFSSPSTTYSGGSVPYGRSTSCSPSQPPEFDFTTVGYHDDQETYNQSQTGTQGSMESLQILVTSAQSVNQQPPSPGVTVTNTSSQTTVINTQQESPEAVSSIQRRVTRKPAPPPPPEKPFTVMVTATTALKPGSDMGSGEPEGNGSNAQFQTWPRSAPLASPESPSEQHKLSGGHEKRSSGERPTMPPPERPRLPQTLNPPLGRGHQRSASTGAVMNQTASSFEPHVGVPNAGSLTSSSILEGDKDIDTINTGVGSETASYSQGSVAQGMSHTLGRHSSMKPRPTPPPPPPPVAKESEDTKL